MMHKSSGLLGSLAPCVLYGSNVERLGSAPRAFTNHCMAYAALCLVGNSFFGWNCLAPWLSYNSRTALRRRFNLQVSILSFLLLCSYVSISITVCVAKTQITPQQRFSYACILFYIRLPWMIDGMSKTVCVIDALFLLYEGNVLLKLVN